MIEQLISYLNASPTAFHAVAQSEGMLEGFTRLEESQPWNLVPGGRYVVTRNQSSLIAFVMPDEKALGFQVVASHTDSPMFKLKEMAELTSQDYVRLNTEGYGGMIISTWLDRPLSIAGRVFARQGNTLATRLVDLADHTVLIPNVAIHMNRELNDGFKYKPNVDLPPLYGLGNSAGTFRNLVADCAGVREEDMLGWDLYLYNRMPGQIWGADNAFFSAPRIDNLECAFCSVQALKGAKASRHVQMIALFDNEEVGSTTRQGAASTFLSDVMERIGLESGMQRLDYLRALHNSMMLSADNAHAVHPNHPEFSDPVNRVFMNKGIVIKANANQKYTSDSVSAGLFRSMLKESDVPYQSYYNRSDMRGGSTLGNISGTQVSLCTVDIGCAQLSMHSCYETAGTQDAEYMTRGMQAFLESDVIACADGTFTLG